MGICASNPQNNPAVSGAPGKMDNPDVGKGGSIVLSKKIGSSEKRNTEISAGGSQILGEGMTKGKATLTDFRDGGQRQPSPISEPIESVHQLGTGPNGEVYSVPIVFGYRSLQGRNPRPPHKPNQDNLVYALQMGDNKDLSLFGVLDGHGPYGEVASYFCYREIPGIMETNPKFDAGDFTQAYEESFKAVHEAFVESSASSDIDAVVSGTTAICTLLKGVWMHTANVGDSRCVMAFEKDGRFIAEALSDDHKPQRVDERARLDSTSAVLLTEKQVRGCGDDDKVYVCRERKGDIVYGVLFTRSIGDYDAHQNLGVESKPEMSETPITTATRFLVLASDGVWDHINNQEVVDRCKDCKDPQEAAESLVEESKTQWATLDQDGRRDDITVMVVEFMWDKADDATKAWLDETTKDLKSTYRWPITEQSPHGPLKS